MSPATSQYLRGIRADLARLTRGDVFAGLLVAVPLFGLLHAIGGMYVFEAALPGIVFAAVAFGRRRVVDRLQARVDGASATMWRIQVNAVDVGRLTDAEYAGLWLDVVREPGAYLRQVFNVWAMFYSFVRQVIGMLPVLAVLALLTMAVVAPADLAHWLASVTTVTAADVIAFVGGGAKFATLVMVGWFALTCALGAGIDGNVLGFRNEFTALAHERMRRHLKVAAVGEVCAWEVDEADARRRSAAVVGGTPAATGFEPWTAEDDEAERSAQAQLAKARATAWRPGMLGESDHANLAVFLELALNAVAAGQVAPERVGQLLADLVRAVDIGDLDSALYFVRHGRAELSRPRNDPEGA